GKFKDQRAGRSLTCPWEQPDSRQVQLKATIIRRSGQISGAEGTGGWSIKEHIPILIKSCRDFGLVPDGLPTVRWLPVNVAAKVVYGDTGLPAGVLRPRELECDAVVSGSEHACNDVRASRRPVRAVVGARPDAHRSSRQ
ncbi:hypothetical protein DFH09DRAFT_1362484, partial [Mycena vulgaris]